MNKTPDVIHQELAALVVKPESEIDFSDLPATIAQDWSDAERRKFYRPINNN